MIYFIIALIIICAIFLYVILYIKKNIERKNNERSIAVQKEKNLNLLIQDVLQTIDKNAPYFKYIYLGSRRNIDSTIHPGDKIEIINYNNEILFYDYVKHGFSPSDDAKKQLAQAISQKYSGKFLEKERNISDDRHRLLVTEYYQVIAHDGLKEVEEIKKKNDSIKKC